mgnify:CR=1 FL=1
MFTILIPTWNNLPYLKVCFESIIKNSSFQHQIIVHINEGADGTTEWVKENNLEHTFSNQNIGICKALNQASILAKEQSVNVQFGYIDGSKYPSMVKQYGIAGFPSVNLFVNGNVTADIGGNATVQVGGNFNADIGGTCDISSGGNMTFTAPRIDLN